MREIWVIAIIGGINPLYSATDINCDKYVLPQGRPMGDGEQCDAGVLGRLVHVTFNVYAHGAGTLVQQGERWSKK